MAASAAFPSSLPSQPAERFFRGALFFLVFTSVAMVVGTGKLDPITVAVAPGAMLYKGIRWLRSKPPEISHRVATWLVLGYLGVFPLDVFFFSRAFVANSTNPDLLAALIGAVHFLLFVMIVRLYSARTDRDALFLAMLAFAAVLAASILTIDSSFLLLFFIFLLFAVATFLAMELRRGARGAITPPFNVQPAQDRRLSRALSLTALSVAVGAIFIGGTLFFVFPRFSAGYLGRASMQPSLMTGFNNNVELGQIGAIKKTSEVVMRVKTGKPVPYSMLRWRGLALTAFDGKRWTNPDRYAETLTPGRDGWIEVANPDQHLDPAAPILEYTILLEPMATDAVFTASDVLSVQGNFSGEGVGSEWVMRHTYLSRDFTGSLFNPFHNYSAVRYNALSRLPRPEVTRLRQAATDYPEEFRVAYLQLPAPLDSRIPELARQATARALTKYDKAVALEAFLRTRFSYTLDLRGDPGADPLAHFLFVTRAGHCEYFASAMTIMLRTLDIPSREVNGFLPGTYNDVAGDYIVRASDAHSWVEAYFPGNGWITFDPTPAATQNTGIFWRLSLYVDWAELTWAEWVINYDFAHQIQMAQSVQRSSRNWTESAQSWFQKKERQNRHWLKSWQRKHAELGVALPVALILFLVALRYDLFRRAVRRARLYWNLRAPESARANPQLASRLYAELLRLLERRGLARLESQTPREFALTVQTPALAPAVQEFTEIYAHARFGGVPCDIPRLRALLSQIREALRGSRGDLAAARGGGSRPARDSA